MAPDEKKKKKGEPHEHKDLERVKTAREILEEKLARMKSEMPVAEPGVPGDRKAIDGVVVALKEAAERAPGETGRGAGTGTGTGTEAGAGTGTGAGTATGAGTGAAEAAPADERTAKLVKERDEWKNEALRARADLDNYQKRIRREMEEVRTFAAAGVLADVIAAIDNLDLALSAVKTAPDIETLVKGVEMVRDQLEKVLRDRGAERIPAESVPFDPRRHEAVLVEERADVPDGTAVAELRRGYTLKNRVLRAAQVKVSRRKVD